jgi:hypothetical protein
MITIKVSLKSKKTLRWDHMEYGTLNISYPRSGDCSRFFCRKPALYLRTTILADFEPDAVIRLRK